MTTKRTALIHNNQRGWHVPLPTYQIVDGSFLPIRKDMITANGVCVNTKPDEVLGLKPTVLVVIPDDIDLDDNGQIIPKSIRAKYRTSLWYGSTNYIPPRLLGDD